MAGGITSCIYCWGWGFRDDEGQGGGALHHGMLYGASPFFNMKHESVVGCPPPPPTPRTHTRSLQINPYVADGEWWRLLTSSFVHGGTLHLLVSGQLSMCACPLCVHAPCACMCVFAIQADRKHAHPPHTHARTHTLTRPCMHTPSHPCTHTPSHTHARTHPHTLMRAHAPSHPCMHTHPHTHACTHPCMHTQPHTPMHAHSLTHPIHTHPHPCMHTHPHTLMHAHAPSHP